MNPARFQLSAAAQPSVSRASWPARAAAGVVRGYQLALSPLQWLLGPGVGCRFAPGCSEYARQSLLTHGLVRGSWLVVCRLAKCHPFHPGGVDPVPSPRRFNAGRMWRPPVEAQPPQS
jgi:hypothetical protein